MDPAVDRSRKGGAGAYPSFPLSMNRRNPWLWASSSAGWIFGGHELRFRWNYNRTDGDWEQGRGYCMNAMQDIPASTHSTAGGGKKSGETENEKMRKSAEKMRKNAEKCGEKKR